MQKFKTEIIEVFTPPFRVAFPALVEPSSLDDSKANYNLLALFNGNEDKSWFYNALYECASKNGLLDANGNWQPIARFPDFKAGENYRYKDTSEIYEGFAQMSVMKFVSSNDSSGLPRPMDIIKPDGSHLAASEVYGGCWCDGLLKLMRIDNKFGTMIISRMDNLRFRGHDEPFATGIKSSSKVFANSELKALPSHVTEINAASLPPQQPGNDYTNAPIVQSTLPPQQPGNDYTNAPIVQSTLPPQQASVMTGGVPRVMSHSNAPGNVDEYTQRFLNPGS